MKAITQVTYSFCVFIFISTSIYAQIKTGIICYQQKITLSFKNTATKTQENDSTGLKSFLLVMAEGKEVSLYHKIVYSGSMSKKYGVDEINTSHKNNYSSDSYVTIRNNIKQTEENFEINDKKIVPTATKKISLLNFKYTGVTKKIMGFSCKEISYELEEGNKKIKVKALVTSELPPSAGFEIYTNVPGAIVQMEVKNRILTIVKFENLKTDLATSFFKP